MPPGDTRSPPARHCERLQDLPAQQCQCTCGRLGQRFWLRSRLATAVRDTPAARVLVRASPPGFHRRACHRLPPGPSGLWYSVSFCFHPASVGPDTSFRADGCHRKSAACPRGTYRWLQPPFGNTGFMSRDPFNSKQLHLTHSCVCFRFMFPGPPRQSLTGPANPQHNLSPCPMSILFNYPRAFLLPQYANDFFGGGGTCFLCENTRQTISDYSATARGTGRCLDQ